jgi:hypothetical protein
VAGDVVVEPAAGRELGLDPFKVGATTVRDIARQARRERQNGAPEEERPDSTPEELPHHVNAMRSSIACSHSLRRG